MYFIQWADPFGMPEKHETKQTRSKLWTENNIKTMKHQLKQLGLSIDWNREISTVLKIIINISKNFY